VEDLGTLSSSLIGLASVKAYFGFQDWPTEVKVFDLRDKLEDEEVEEDEIEKQCDELREKLTKEAESGKGLGRGKNLKMHQVHELAEAKIQESEKLRKALGIKEGREGMVWEEKREQREGAQPKTDGSRS